MINVYISSILLFFTVFFLGAIVNSTLIYTVKSTGAVASSWGFISTSILIGFVLVVVPVAYGLSFDIPNHYLFYLPFIIALAASLVGLKDHKKFIHSFCSHLNYKNLILITILFSLSILLVNTGKEELLKIRLGIDAALYTQAAQELLDGSTFGQLKAEYSIAAFIVHLRWGVPILMYFFAKILGATSVFEILPAFYLLCTFVLLTTTYAVIGSVTKSKIYGVYFTILLALNVNLVNALWECQWANFIALPFISFIILLFSTDGLTKGDRNYRYLTFILLLSFVILVFSEIIPAIFIFFGPWANKYR